MRLFDDVVSRGKAAPRPSARNGTTWRELAILAGAGSSQQADALLWNGTAFPFADARTVWRQLRHVLRHRVCFDDPEASCGP